MKLDFNFKVKDLTGEVSRLDGVKAMLDIFNFSSTVDDTYHDKKKDWAKELKADGTLSDVDKTDAKKLQEWILKAAGVFDFVKIYLRDYIDERVKLTWPEKSEKDDDQSNRKTRRSNSKK